MPCDGDIATTDMPFESFLTLSVELYSSTEKDGAYSG